MAKGISTNSLLLHRVSRGQLYDSQSESEGEFVLPELEFEIVDKESTEATQTIPTEQSNVPEDKEEDQEEFDFPLFSFGGSSTTEEAKGGAEQDTEVTHDEERGRPKTVIQKISLREPSVEKIIQSRPESYYFQRFTEEDHARHESIAITYDQILKHSTERNNHGRVWDLTQYNAKIEQQIARDTRKKGRPGKKARAAKKIARENEKAREKVKKIEKQRELKKLMKKIHHKRGGKKNKTKANAAANVNAKPKYRTE